MLRCENLFCIYYSENHCLSDEISLDIQGNCQDCIYVAIEEDQLKKERKKILDSHEEQYAKWEIIDKYLGRNQER